MGVNPSTKEVEIEKKKYKGSSLTFSQFEHILSDFEKNSYYKKEQVNCRQMIIKQIPIFLFYSDGMGVKKKAIFQYLKIVFHGEQRLTCGSKLKEIPCH